jgi:hypothetical protein
MHDAPSPEQLLAAVARFLRDDAGPALARNGDGALAYQARVASNMLAIAGRELRLGPAADAAEAARLQALLGDGAGPADLRGLNQRLAQAIASADLDLHSPGLADHLWLTTLDKLAVDQPGYDSYRRQIGATPDADRDSSSKT